MSEVKKLWWKFRCRIGLPAPFQVTHEVYMSTDEQLKSGAKRFVTLHCKHCKAELRYHDWENGAS